MRKGTMAIKRVVITLSLLFGAWLPLVGYAHFVGNRPEKDLSPTTWVTGQKIRQLTEYHGTDALKITQDRVFIRRDSQWIPVLKREPG